MSRKPSPFILLLCFALACTTSSEEWLSSQRAGIIQPPTDCGINDPACLETLDFPTQAELTTANSSNISYTSGVGLGLVAGSGVLIDSDGDTVPDDADECPGPGWRIPCDGDASNDGIYQTLFFGASGELTLGTDIQVTTTIPRADAYILMDATGSMGGEQAQLVQDMVSGSFVSAVECPTGFDKGLIGALRCAVNDLWIGVGMFAEVPLAPATAPFTMAPYHHLLDTTADQQHILDAVSAMTIHNNWSIIESAPMALYSVVTGRGLGPFVPNRGACPSTPAGRWGYPCFRSGALPIIIHFTDAEMFNGPRATSPSYDASTFSSGGGVGMRLPPVEMDPQLLYASDIFSAHNLGDLTSKSVSVMGSNRNLDDSFQTWDVGACMFCGGSGCWGDGRDSVVRFSLGSTTSTAVSGQGSWYSEVNLALVDSTPAITDCDPGPGSGDFWGRLNTSLPAGTHYAVADTALTPSEGINSGRGPFQIRIQTTPDDPSWQTTDLPIAWTDVETELLATGMKVVSVVSPNSTGMVGLPDAQALGVATGSVDSMGNPFVETVAANGSGLSTAVIDAVRSLLGDSPRDITMVAEDNPATTAVDETDFVINITAANCPTTGLSTCTGGAGTNTCTGCLSGTLVRFDVRIGNSIIAPTATPQVFEFDLVGYADGIIELARIPVRVVVPPTGSAFGVGLYQNTYDSTTVCNVPPQRPDWGELTWTGTTPSDSSIEFQLFAADSPAEIDTVSPVTIAIPADTTDSVIDIGQWLNASQITSFTPYLRVRARLIASSDTMSTPVLEGWSMRFMCQDFQ